MGGGGGGGWVGTIAGDYGKTFSCYLLQVLRKRTSPFYSSQFLEEPLQEVQGPAWDHPVDGPQIPDGSKFLYRE